MCNYKYNIDIVLVSSLTIFSKFSYSCDFIVISGRIEVKYITQMRLTL